MLISIILIALICSRTEQIKVVSGISKIVNSLKESYNKDVRPNAGGDPVQIGLSFSMVDISSVSEVQMEMTADFYLRQRWTDNRLTFNGSVDELILSSSNFFNSIWLPDTFMANSRSVTVHTLTTSENHLFFKLRSNGTVYYGTRLTAVVICPMNFERYPMDSQTCSLLFESYSYHKKDVNYTWMHKDSSMPRQITLPNFKITAHRFETKEIISGQREYSVLVVEIKLSRSMVYYFNQVYVPALMIVVISWIPFWLDRDDSHARVGLGVTTVLTMTTLVTQTNSAMPKISYMKSLDIYLEFCFAMVFAALIQYAIVGYLSQRKANKVLDSDAVERFGFNDDRYGLKVKSIDFHSRWIFPLTYLLFNMWYWIRYLLL